MKLSSKTKYGIKACHFLGLNYNVAPVSASTLENYIQVSGKYLEKIMRMLSARNIVKAERGANGGYLLCRPPKEISIGEIVRALEDDIELVECVKDNPKCKCCPTSGVWKRLHEGINNILNGMNLQEMIDGEIR